MNMMAERVESLKAAMLGGLSIAVAQVLTNASTFVATTLNSKLVSHQSFYLLSYLGGDIQDYRWWINTAIAVFSGFLFGITYRYIIRTDNNPHLKAGGVMAFGLIRGLTQVEMGFTYTNNILPFVVLATESILYFGLARVVLDIAIQRGWVKPFKSN